MNRNVVFILSLALAVVVVLSGCNRPMSSGPIPKPQTAGTGAPTVEPMSQVTPVAPAPSGATATPQGAAAGPVPTATKAAGSQPAPTAPPAQAAQATPVPAVRPTTAPAASGEPTKHTVKPGEWLFSIARQYNVSPFTLAQVNKIGAPYNIYPGQVLTIPGSQPPAPTPPPAPGTCSSPYTVQAGDTIYSIARKCGKTPSAILSANNLANPNFLLVGQKLQIP